MMSSCTSAQACTSSSAAHARSTACAVGAVGIAAGTEPAHPGEGRADPFAAAQHELLELVDRRHEIAADAVDEVRPGGEEVGESGFRPRTRGRPGRLSLSAGKACVR